jgi:hypothetical protein
MLPGFRFLFAAIILCFSILVFGLGAAALLRAAHEEFASKPSWRGMPATVFAQPSEASRLPVLALLQVEPEGKEPAPNVANQPVSEPVAQPRPSEQPGQDDTSSAAPSPEPAAAPTPAPEPQKVEALSAPEAERPVAPSAPEETPTGAAAKGESALSEPAKVEDGKSQNSLGEGQPTVERSSSPAQVPISERETKTATSEDATPKAAEPTPAPSEPMKTPASVPQPQPQADPVAALIATLGGSPNATDMQAPPKAANGVKSAAPDKNAIRKRLWARHAVAAAKERRRVVQRARITQHDAAVQQQQFSPPFLMEPSGAAAQAH